MFAVALVGALSAPKPVILVADVGIDDAGGLLWAAASDALEILGVISSFGCHPDPVVTARNAELLLEAAGRSEIPVYIGADVDFRDKPSRWPPWKSTLGRRRGQPLQRDGRHVHGADGFGGVFAANETQCAAAKRESGAEFIAQTARARPGEVTILCFSALTNVALAATLEPALPSLLKELVVMGGSIYGPGNMSPLAEANFGMDATAARFVIDAFAPADDDAVPKVVLAPLDVTHAALLTQAEVDAAGKTSRAAALLSKAWTQYANFYCAAAGMCDGTPMHDAHTVAYAIEPSMYTNVTTLAVQVTAQHARDCRCCLSLLTSRRFPLTAGARHSARAAVARHVPRRSPLPAAAQLRRQSGAPIRASRATRSRSSRHRRSEVQCGVRRAHGALAVGVIRRQGTVRCPRV